MQKVHPRSGCVAVTGASGLIGRRLMSALQKTRTPTRALIRPTSGFSGGSAIVGTMLDREALQQLVAGCGAVVHLAGVAHTSLRNAEEEEQARAVNVEGTRKLVEAARNAGVQHFLLMSSAHVYRGQEGLAISEDSPTEGDTAYGRMKLEAESIVLGAQSETMRVTVLRPCLTYGPGVRFNLQNLMRAVRRGYYVHVRGARVIRSMASVDTVTAAVVHLLDSQTRHSVFNVADREPVNLEEWTNHLADLMQAKHPRSAPRTVMNAVGGLGSALRAFGLPAPVTHDSVRKLSSSFSISTKRLASTGFNWPETRETVLREMISAEFTAKP